MSNELTYILGAGASYQSIPVVKTFPKRFEEFVFETATLKLNPELAYRAQYEKFHQACNIFSNEIKSHQSFDTYFKKLFHTNQFDLINQSKVILNAYFTWEHLERDFRTKERNNPRITESHHLGEFDFKKTSTIDKRYDALIAGLLKPNKGKAEVFCKTNFITWNYDLNLFFSLKNYFAPDKNVKNFLDSISINEYEWNIENQISVINMNGYFYSSKFNELTSFNDREGMSILKELMRTGISEDQILTDAQKIKFAWETELNHAKMAKERIISSKNIVIIGYTFPLYNRLVDFEYLERDDFGLNKKVVIQDPNADKVRQNILELFELNETSYVKGGLIAKTDCESFYVPSNIYGRKNNQVYT